MTVRELDKAPSLPQLYGKAAISARGRRGNLLPDISFELKEVEIDRDHLARYALVCGFRLTDVLPPTYPHILAFPAAVTLMVDPAFPFALAGLVHINNRIEQKRALKADERLTFRVHAENLHDHPRGRQFDMITEASIDGQPVWTESSTYLHRLPKPKESTTSQSTPPSADSPSPLAGEGRGGGSQESPSPLAGEGRGGGSQESPSPLAGEGRGGGLRQTAIWRIPSDIGRRYAAVSGDVNPIHLNPLAARLFGFKRAIAHGMWLKARCLAAFEGRLPDWLTVDVEFKSPLLLPSTVAFSSAQDGRGWLFAVNHASSGRPHLFGSISGV